MSRLTPMLLPPSLAEIKALAKILNEEEELDPPLTDADCKAFFCHYESNGWRVGKVRMCSTRGALHGWHLRRHGYESNGHAPGPNGHAKNGAGKPKSIWEVKAVLETVDRKIRDIETKGKPAWAIKAYADLMRNRKTLNEEILRRAAE